MADFNDPSLKAEACSLSFQLPKLKIGFSLPPLPALPPIPIPPLPLGLSCSPDKPTDVTGPAPYGGGRQVKRDPDPDLEDK